jgi:hypothetical protein
MQGIIMRRWAFMLVLAAMSSSPHAQLFTLPQGTSVAEQPHLAGSVVAQTTTSFSYLVESALGDIEPLPVSGTVMSMVVHAIDGTFDFYWRIALDQGGLGQMTFDRPFGASAVFDWRSDLDAGVAPTFVGCCGSTFGLFAFYDIDELMSGYGSTTFTAPATSAFLMVDTAATAYAANTHFAFDTVGGAGFRLSGSSGPYETFGPTGGTCSAPGLLSKLRGAFVRGAARS